MPLLRCEGAFVVPVPAGWEVFGVPGSHYVLTPVLPPTAKARGGEVRLAVLPRERGPFAEREGADRLVRLLRELEIDPDDEEVALQVRYSADAHRAFAWFPAYDADGHDLDCLAAVVVLPANVIAVTATTSPRRPEVISTAELLAASLSPDSRRRR